MFLGKGKEVVFRGGALEKLSMLQYVVLYLRGLKCFVFESVNTRDWDRKVVLEDREKLEGKEWGWS